MRNNKRTVGAGKFTVVGIISVVVLFNGCAAITEGQKSQPVPWVYSDPKTSWMTEAGRYFIEPEMYTLLTEEFGNFWGKKIDNRQVILTIPQGTKIHSLEYLISEYNVAFSTTNMPGDLEMYLKDYWHKEYGNYYNYVKTFVDTIILCPKFDEEEYGGISWQNRYDTLLYPEGGRLIFLNASRYFKAPSNYAAILQIAMTTAHETAHKEIIHLIDTGKLPDNYITNYERNERAALIINIELLEAMLLRVSLPKEARDHLQYLYNVCLRKFRGYNRTLGLPVENRQRFP